MVKFKKGLLPKRKWVEMVMGSVKTLQKEFASVVPGFKLFSSPLPISHPFLYKYLVLSYTNIFLLGFHSVDPSCKYRHVGDKQDPDTVPFCKDFQSDRYLFLRNQLVKRDDPYYYSGCNYESDNGRSCAFVHAPRAATEEYYRTGEQPPHGINQYLWSLVTSS